DCFADQTSRHTIRWMQQCRAAVSHSTPSVFRAGKPSGTDIRGFACCGVESSAVRREVWSAHHPSRVVFINAEDTPMDTRTGSIALTGVRDLARRTIARTRY